MSVYNGDLIKPRSLTYTPVSEPQKYWLDNCPIKTYLGNAFALYIPSVEKFFIYSVRACQSDIADPALKQAVKGFIQQEARHCRAHIDFMRQQIDAFYPDFAIKPPGSISLKFLRLFGARKMHIALTAAGEHFTAVSADLILRNPNLQQQASPEITRLWQIHFLEEIEHKSVAFDTMQAMGGGYFLRCFSFIILNIMLMSSNIYTAWRMLKMDNQHKNWRMYGRFFKCIFWEPGLLKNFVWPYLSYLKPGFHPWQHNNRDLVREWDARL